MNTMTTSLITSYENVLNAKKRNDETLKYECIAISAVNTIQTSSASAISAIKKCVVAAEAAVAADPSKINMDIAFSAVSTLVVTMTGSVLQMNTAMYDTTVANIEQNKAFTEYCESLIVYNHIKEDIEKKKMVEASNILLLLSA
jgi:hypothetical protein